MATSQVIHIPGVTIDTLQLVIVGDTPLLCHKFSARQKEEMLAKQMGKPLGKKAPKDPQLDYEESTYVAKEGWYGFPAGGIKAACVECAKRFVDDLHGTEAKGAFFVIAQGLDRDTGHPLVRLEGEPEMHESIVRLSGAGNVADIRYRALFPDWRISFSVRYNPHVITAEGIANLLQAAGFHIGLGDWRPGSPKGNPGTFGMFHVEGAP